MNIFKKLAYKINNKKRFYSFRKQNIYIHPDSEIGYFTSIGFGTNINGPAFIASHKTATVTIGKYCAIAHNLRIRSRNHHTGYINMQVAFQGTYGHSSVRISKGGVKIGHGVWIADNVIILSGVDIGNGAVIGAGAIVTKSIPPYSIAVGSPARVIRKRYSDQIIEQLLLVQWWDWSEEKIKKNQAFFETDFSKKNDNFEMKKLIVD